MKTPISFRFPVLALTALLGALPLVCAHAQEGVQAPAVHNGSPSDSNLRFVGRWDKSELATYKSYWGGAYVRARFTGTAVALKGGSAAGGPTVMVSLDGEPLRETGEFKVEGLKPGVHTLLVGAPGQNSEVDFQGLTLDAGATTLPVEAKPIIEFVGDSITTGGGQTRPGTVNYAWQSAELLGADHTQIAFSGRALTTGYGCGEDKAALDTQYFQLKNFNHLKNGPQVAWKADYQPQIVVINLGQNDQCGQEPAATFQASYEGFIKKIRAQMPMAHIVALRPFGGPYEKGVRAAVEATNAAGDKKVTFVDTTGWLQAADYVDGTHPNQAGHDQVAAKLAPILRPFLTPPDSKMSNQTPVGQAFDLQGFIDRAVQAGQKRIVIAPGRYRVKPRDRQHLVLQNLQDVQIIADGVEMICTETTRALTISNCRNLTLRGLTIDYDPLPFTQGRITSLSADKSVAEIELFDGFPRAKTAVNFKFEIFKPDTRTLRYDAPGPEKVEAIDDRNLRLSWNRARPNDPEQVGDLIVIGSEDAPGGQIPHAVVLEKSRNVRLENLDLWASNCFGFLETECDGTVYGRCRIDRRPPARDLVVRADARLRSLNADAYHSKDAAKGPQILNCTAKFMGDDAVNICGHYSMIASAKGAELRVLVNGAALQSGDIVELWSYAGVRLPDARVVKVEADGKINEAERAFLLQQRMDEGFRTRWTPDAQRVTLDCAVDVGLGALVGSTQRMGNGFKVQNCDFGFNRSRGILIKASNGEVVGNTIKGSFGPAILVAPEYWWLESGSSNNVLIQRNRIEDCQSTAIEVVAHAGKGGLAPSGAHSDISIINNTILGCALPNIVATSTAGLRIGGNDLTPSKTRQLSDWALGMLSLDKTKLEAIMAPNCDAPVIKNNIVR